MSDDAGLPAQNIKLYEILEVNERVAGAERVKSLASLRAGLVDAPDAKSVARKLEALDTHALTGALTQMLDVNTVALLVQGWGQLAKIRTAIRKSVVSPATPQTAVLASHTFEAKLKPRLVLSLGGVDWMQVDFEVVFSGEVTSAELTIVSGKLSSLKLGPAKASVKVSCEGAELHDFSRPVALLPAYELTPPLALTRAREALVSQEAASSGTGPE